MTSCSSRHDGETKANLPHEVCVLETVGLQMLQNLRAPRAQSFLASLFCRAALKCSLAECSSGSNKAMFGEPMAARQAGGIDAQSDRRDWPGSPFQQPIQAFTSRAHVVLTTVRSFQAPRTFSSLSTSVLASSSCRLRGKGQGIH